MMLVRDVSLIAKKLAWSLFMVFIITIIININLDSFLKEQLAKYSSIMMFLDLPAQVNSVSYSYSYFLP